MSTPSLSNPRELVDTGPGTPRPRDQACACPPAGAVTSEQLLGGRREILIQHGRNVYRLRHTSNDKLILTK